VERVAPLPRVLAAAASGDCFGSVGILYSFLRDERGCRKTSNDRLLGSVVDIVFSVSGSPALSRRKSLQTTSDVRSDD
jgi:hypothetical protein